jgi:tRNA (guanine10-N2)-dimethyltransferase
MKLFVLSKENIPLAAAEAERLHGTEASHLLGNLLFLDVTHHEETLALTREIHNVLFATKAKDLPAALTAFPWHERVESPFLVRKNGPSPLSEAELAGFVWRGLEAAGKRPTVDLKAPLTQVYLFFIEDEVVVASLRWRNDERFSERRSHLRPRNHPTGMSPKLARAMINLAGPPSSIRSVLDPFCGSGGILIEAGLVGREMTGVDIDPEQVKRAEENVGPLGLAATLTVADATTCDALGRFDAIVTDLPYGKGSRLRDAETTFTAFFEAARSCAPVLVVGGEEGAGLERLFRGWSVKGSFRWYLHKHLSKRIYVLERV